MLIVIVFVPNVGFSRERLKGRKGLLSAFPFDEEKEAPEVLEVKGLLAKDTVEVGAETSLISDALPLFCSSSRLGNMGEVALVKDTCLNDGDSNVVSKDVLETEAGVVEVAAGPVGDVGADGLGVLEGVSEELDAPLGVEGSIIAVVEFFDTPPFNCSLCLGLIR